MTLYHDAAKDLVEKIKSKKYFTDVTAQVLDPFARFIVIKVYCNALDAETLAPPKHVEIVWRYCILQMEPYRLFCKEVCGTFLHYNPLVALDERKYNIRLRDSCLKYQDIFGQKAPDSWNPNPIHLLEFEVPTPKPQTIVSVSRAWRMIVHSPNAQDPVIAHKKPRIDEHNSELEAKKPSVTTILPKLSFSNVPEVIDTLLKAGYTDNLKTFLQGKHVHVSLVRELVCFLVMKQVYKGNDQRPTSPIEIDRAWRQFILFTNDYELFCSSLSGTPIIDYNASKGNLRYTLQLYQHSRLGTPPQDIWIPARISYKPNTQFRILIMTPLGIKLLLDVYPSMKVKDVHDLIIRGNPERSPYWHQNEFFLVNVTHEELNVFSKLLDCSIQQGDTLWMMNRQV